MIRINPTQKNLHDFLTHQSNLQTSEYFRKIQDHTASNSGTTHNAFVGNFQSFKPLIQRSLSM